ncbi:MAG: NAD+ synthase [Proteobacteria bacterium]|nr:NAD+ synthase [Pseudomonadota bacterium]
MTNTVTIALAQIDLAVGDVAGNTAKILDYATRARNELQADLVIFPELSVCGYPPEDLLFHSGLRKRTEQAVAEIRASVRDIAILIGFPEYVDDDIYNSCAVLKNGQLLCSYRKQCLPNYSVFDEERYFEKGKKAAVFRLNGIAFGLTICEDIWQTVPTRAARAAGAECILSINGSPYELNSQQRRETAARARISEIGVPMVYLNMVGGQDELVFDGGSFGMQANGDVAFRAAAFEDNLCRIEVHGGSSDVTIMPGAVAEPTSTEAIVYGALVRGTRDYVDKHGFPGVIIGLSGGVDSALVAAIACDALGPSRVRSVMMPFKYTATMSQEDAALLAKALGIRYDVVPIGPLYDASVAQLGKLFTGLEPDVTEENIQARCRGLLLMAISNKTGVMLLTTGNKSEMAVGYATLYGDMAGGFAPIKDCSKTLVYRLARYRNSISPVIPERIITRPPSAELRANQKDSDSLPDYNVLDPILEGFIEEDLSVDAIVARGFDRDVVIRILEMVKRNEYKRRQAPPGVRISSRAFGRDWRYPITSGYKFPE